MTTHKEALKLALEALKRNMEAGLTGIKIDEAITAIKEALAQPEQEPTWWLVEYHDWAREFVTVKPEESIAVKKITAFYTTPPQRTWVGLTWDDIADEDAGNLDFYRGAKWAEAKLKEKNT